MCRQENRECQCNSKGKITLSRQILAREVDRLSFFPLILDSRETLMKKEK